VSLGEATNGGMFGFRLFLRPASFQEPSGKRKEVISVGSDPENERSQADLDNHANQLNPEHDAYWESRGYDERPDDWREHDED